jgi:2-polyprenyl-3-methyl-5-hydroxy-6-metoxy-1,4-benzoquinol methylase
MMASNRYRNNAFQRKVCPVCGDDDLHEILDIQQMPVLSNVLWEERADAISSPRGDVCLGYCQNCGHCFNLAFDPQVMAYSVTYENSLHFSPRFQAYAEWLAQHLIDQYDLHGKNIIEIGSGKGDFLKKLCDQGKNTGLGFDPSYQPSSDDQHPAVTLIPDYYSDRYLHHHADLILSRHTLEHLDQPLAFMNNLRQMTAGQKDTVVFLEVPNLGYMLREVAVWDIIYEHFSYFSAQSLMQLALQSGFRVLDVAEVYEDQFLTIEAAVPESKWGSSALEKMETLPALNLQAAQFATRAHQKLTAWRKEVQRLKAEQRRAVVWGAGTKGISFLNILSIQDEIQYVVDINPRKRNMYITGTGQQIVPPDFLLEYQPDTVILMNPIYRQEIGNTLKEMGLDVEILVAG